MCFITVQWTVESCGQCFHFGLPGDVMARVYPETALHSAEPWHPSWKTVPPVVHGRGRAVLRQYQTSEGREQGQTRRMCEGRRLRQQRWDWWGCHHCGINSWGGVHAVRQCRSRLGPVGWWVPWWPVLHHHQIPAWGSPSDSFWPGGEWAWNSQVSR